MTLEINFKVQLLLFLVVLISTDNALSLTPCERAKSHNYPDVILNFMCGRPTNVNGTWWVSKRTRPPNPGRGKWRTLNQFNARCLEAHNHFRALHGAPSLELDESLVKFAKYRAMELLKIEDLVHNTRGRGENLAWFWSSDKNRKSEDCWQVVQAWYDENQLYSCEKAEFKPEVGHFTQLVWKSTTKVGCAQLYAKTPRGGVYTVCNYMRPGNELGRFRSNVKRPLADKKKRKWKRKKFVVKNVGNGK